MLTADVKEYIRRSVLCWLATTDDQHQPNVSPKEMFTYQDDHTLLIAHIASPVSIKNIRINPKVCVSFIDVFAQQGYKIKGEAVIIDSYHADFKDKVKPLIDLYSDEFPVHAVIDINVTQVDPIKAPSYFLYPDRTLQQQIQGAMKTYGVKSANQDLVGGLDVRP